MSAEMSAAQKLSTKLNVPADHGDAGSVRVRRPSATLADPVPLDFRGHQRQRERLDGVSALDGGPIG